MTLVLVVLPVLCLGDVETERNNTSDPGCVTMATCGCFRLEELKA